MAPLSITVVVPVRNEAAAIESTLRVLLTQDYPTESYEVIVADGASTDATVPIIRRLQAEFPHLKLLFNAKRWSSAGRNLGIRHSQGDAIIVVDGHCGVPDQRYLSRVAQAFESSQAEVLGRPQPLEAPNPTRFQQALSVARQSRLGHNPDSDIFSEEAKFVRPQSTAVAYRQTVFHQIGLFDESFDACEDVELNERVDYAGFRCFFTPTIKIEYHPRSSWLALVKQLGRYGCGRARLAWKHPRSLTIPALVPPLWVAFALLGWLGCFWSDAWSWLYLGLWGAYLGVVALVSLALSRGLPFAVAWRLPGVFVGIHLGFALGFWGEIRRQLRHAVKKSV